MVRHPASTLTLTLLGVGARGYDPRPPAVPPRNAGVAPAPRTYTDAAHGYALRYPRPWIGPPGVGRGWMGGASDVRPAWPSCRDVRPRARPVPIPCHIRGTTPAVSGGGPGHSAQGTGGCRR